MNIFLSLLERTGADCAAVAFDLKAPTFRHKMYDGYKAGRKPAPKELIEQFEPLKEILSSLGYTVVEKEGYEADDILLTFPSDVPQGVSHDLALLVRCFQFCGFAQLRSD